MNTRLRLVALAAVLALLTPALRAQVPQLINYQGRVAVGAVNFNGSGLFKFALVDAGGTITYWSNDSTSASGSEPTAAVTLTVTKGLYSVLLGDATLPNMTVVPGTVFTHADVRLRVWFNDGTNGFQLLTPDQRIAAVGYAIMAAGVNLPATTSATEGVIMQSGNPLLHTFGLNNFFAGFNAGNFTMSGGNNTASGYQALTSSTTGSSNTANGTSALQFNTTGAGNTANGYNALQLNTVGNSNTASGSYALYSNTTGGNNTASGSNALQSNTTGSNNIALGFGAGINLTTGGNNIDIGHAGVAAEANIIRIGTAQTDTFLTGIIHGDGSGLTGVTATVGPGSITSTQIANGAVGSAQLASGLTFSGNVGIGTASPGAALDVQSGNIRAFNGNGGAIEIKRTSDGWTPASIVVSQDSSYMGLVEFKQNTANTVGGVPTTTMSLYRGNVGIGTATPTSKLLVNQGNILVYPNANTFLKSTDGITTADFSLQSEGVRLQSNLGLLLAAGSTERMRIDASGNVGIGTTSPGSLLEIKGTTNTTVTGIGLTKPAGGGAFNWSINNGIGGLDNGALSFAAGGSDKLTILGAGKVGIGTTSPATTLDVNGTVTARGTINAVGGLIIENRTSDPATPATGQIWLRTDL